nr:hypothetical protein [Kibdelosporangium sp. MJ126-NF4]CEL17623.1 hypothetical protein [Kibdelosporangium sp. MJ126-NF4]CTQ91149.1 hypothetical protein [Kibdelosporangium sp. MJ126-NF4]
MSGTNAPTVSVGIALLHVRFQLAIGVSWPDRRGHDAGHVIEATTVRL